MSFSREPSSVVTGTNLNQTFSINNPHLIPDAPRQEEGHEKMESILTAIQKLDWSWANFFGGPLHY
jgi:hypothetical protein